MMFKKPTSIATCCMCKEVRKDGVYRKISLHHQAYYCQEHDPVRIAAARIAAMRLPVAAVMPPAIVSLDP